MPNIEHVIKSQKRYFKSTHTLIAKTRAAYNIFTDYFKKSGLDNDSPRIFYAGHSSLDPLFRYGKDLPSYNFTNVFHAYGDSATKGTVPLIKCWMKHPEWPTLTILGNSNEEKLKGYSKPRNIKFLDTVGHAELGILQRESAIHIYPTESEGFGHALNEARASGALLVTSKFGPMNEFVEDGYSGFLIDIKMFTVYDSQLFGEFGPVQVHMDSLNICKTMKKVFKTDMAERKRMGVAGRAGFLADRVYFKETVKILRNEAMQFFQ